MTRIQVSNVRVGFATNSSSSHSILILPGHGLEDGGQSDGFGWEAFVLASRDEKRRYLASQIADEVGFTSWPSTHAHHVGNAAALAIVESILGPPVPDDVGYVDHQSDWALPRDWADGDRLDEGFARAMAAFLDRSDVVVLGGNDNNFDHVHPLYEREEIREARWRGGIPSDSSGVGLVARRDELDPASWTLFNRGSGGKARVVLGEGAPPERASAPELVDVKITDYCPYGCDFCYQGSTVAGRHAPLERLVDLAEALGEARVFEVALGGGEPTLHPGFIRVLEAFRDRGVVPNFTTRNLGWLKAKRTVQAVERLAGSFAYSCTRASDVEALARALRAAGWAGRAPTVHVVMGTVRPQSFRGILAQAKTRRFGVTLLGWKRTGRAADRPPPVPYLAWWRGIAEESGPWRLGVDTALAAEAEAAGQLDDVPRRMFHTEDGPFSCYVDAVAGTIAPSSWQPERGSHPMGADWLRAFRSFS